MRGVEIDEPSPTTSKQWNTDLNDFVCQLTFPKQSLEPATNHFNCNGMRLIPTDLAKDMKDKCRLVSEKEIQKPTTNWRKLMSKNGGPANYESFDIDEGVELSIDSMSSSSGLKDSKVVFSCDSSPETSDLEVALETKLTDLKTVHAKKDKESKRRRFKRMITRPLRRSHSAGCENDIPSHAFLLDSSQDNDNDTMESRANELSLYHQRLFGNSQGTDQREHEKVHKTCSADAAMMGASDNSTNPKSKSRNLAKNVKRKFQFLRRRNTDTALVPKFSLPLQFTIPSYEQAFQWSKSFDSLLNDKNGLELFKGFLKSEFSEENLEFWIACEEFRFIKESSMAVSAQKIYGEFIVFQAPKEINLDSQTRMTTVSRLENPSNDTFQVAQHKIQALMEKDSYPRFLESDLYQQLLISISKA